MDVPTIPVTYSNKQDVSNLDIDKDRLDFHLIHNDYFGVQATVLGFIEERLLRCEEEIGATEHSGELALLRQFRAEAIYLHQNRYTIKPSKL